MLLGVIDDLLGKGERMRDDIPGRVVPFTRSLPRLCVLLHQNQVDMSVSFSLL